MLTYVNDICKIITLAAEKRIQQPYSVTCEKTCKICILKILRDIKCIFDNKLDQLLINYDFTLRFY